MSTRFGEDRYHVIREVGRGGMATVFEVDDRRLGVRRALKRLHPSLHGDAEIVARFRNEARIMAQISHPHVVAVTDVGEDDDGLWLVMELVDGGTLGEAAAASGGMLPTDAARVLLGVLDALRVAHARGVVHRDVKPQNVLLTTDGVAKLADFGIAQLASLEDLTRTGVLLGSWATMAPEQRVDSKKVGPASDLWSLAATMVSVAEGRVVSDLHVVEHRSVTLSRWPPALAGVLHRALAYAPEHRFQRADEMLVALRDALGEPNLPRVQDLTPASVFTVRSGVPSRVIRSSRALGVAPAAALLLGVSVGAGAMSYEGLRAALERETPSVARARALASLPLCDGAPTRWEFQHSQRRIAGQPGGREVGGGRMVDVDADGTVDVLYTASLDEQLRVYWGESSGALPETAQLLPALRTSWGGAQSLDAGDLDGDGHLDLVAAAPENMGFVVLLGRGARRFDAARRVDTGMVPWSVRVADWDGDGHGDLFAHLVAGTSPDLYWRSGSGDGVNFGSERRLLQDAGAMDVADVDGDGRAELLVFRDGMLERYVPTAEHRIGAPASRWPVPLEHVGVVRVLSTPDGTRVFALEGGMSSSPTVLRWTPEGDACRMDVPGDNVLGDIGYFNADTTLDLSAFVTCGYCTSKHIVHIGLR